MAAIPIERSCGGVRMNMNMGDMLLGETFIILSARSTISSRLLSLTEEASRRKRSCLTSREHYRPLNFAVMSGLQVRMNHTTVRDNGHQCGLKRTLKAECKYLHSNDNLGVSWLACSGKY